MYASAQKRNYWSHKKSNGTYNNNSDYFIKFQLSYENESKKGDRDRLSLFLISFISYIKCKYSAQMASTKKKISGCKAMSLLFIYVLIKHLFIP